MLLYKNDDGVRVVQIFVFCFFIKLDAKERRTFAIGTRFLLLLHISTYSYVIRETKIFKSFHRYERKRFNRRTQMY